ncbi:hypothetical protein WP12_12145 [Sphingomonas sp. SRS2]|nr:hypothetical protein WP12_12145 [Sphingomonas sp. SRS2]
MACALGVLGDDVDGPSKCPAAIMPRWLAQMVPWFFDRQKPAEALAWGRDFYAELKRLDGNVPFSVVYDWQANVVTQMGIDAAIKRDRDPAPHQALQALHRRALAGDVAPKGEWQPVLKNADAYADAYAYANANAYANADAYAYAYANANANAYAYADADADAYAYADADAYANANAYANAINKLATGLVECLRRVEVMA